MGWSFMFYGYNVCNKLNKSKLLDHVEQSPVEVSVYSVLKRGVRFTSSYFCVKKEVEGGESELKWRKI